MVSAFICTVIAPFPKRSDFNPALYANKESYNPTQLPSLQDIRFFNFLPDLQEDDVESLFTEAKLLVFTKSKSDSVKVRTHELQPMA